MYLCASALQEDAEELAKGPSRDHGERDARRHDGNLTLEAHRITVWRKEDTKNV